MPDDVLGGYSALTNYYQAAAFLILLQLGLYAIALLLPLGPSVNHVAQAIFRNIPWLLSFYTSSN